MKIATFTLVGISRYGQNKQIMEPKKEKESAFDHEERTWKQRMHINSDGEIYIPPMSLKWCLAECAKFISMQVSGKAKATFTKHFEAGLLVLDDMLLGVKEEDVKSEWLSVPSDGQRGGKKRVSKCFPYLETGWRANAKVHILDDTITEEVFRYHLEQAGKFIGLGRFRPRNGGFYGRFRFENLAFEVVDEEAA